MMNFAKFKRLGALIWLFKGFLQLSCRFHNFPMHSFKKK